MRPAARVAAIIGLIAEIETETTPADRVLERFFRRARYAGSKDRRALRDGVYAVLRHRARLDWWLGRVNHVQSPRSLVIARELLLNGSDPDALAALFDGSPYGAESLDAQEQALARHLAAARADTPSAPEDALYHPDMPDWVRLECPQWLFDSLHHGLGNDADVKLVALNRPAPVDFRVNTLRGARQEVIDSLAEHGIVAHPGPHSPWGLRIEGSLRLSQTEAFKRGALEVQDEGSQILSLLTDARPDMTVVDYCAGAGGKTLALAAAMQDRGRIFALDPAEARLARMAPRLERAGVTIVTAGREPGAASADRVLVDAPCSGIGRWRRAPEERWRLNEKKMDRLLADQAKIMDRAARLVTPGGRLVYATCSLLPSENAGQVDAFLARHDNFQRMDAPALWTGILGAPCPLTGPDLTLSPTTTDTDGFYLSVLEKNA